MLTEFLISLKNKIPPNIFAKLINFWPPFIGAGIKVTDANTDMLSITVEMKLKWYNKNYVGTHFGGSLFAMCDPFYMLILINKLGSKYIVWDKASKIDFIKPGKGKVKAIFSFSNEEIKNIEEQAEIKGKHIFNKKVEIIDSEGMIVALVEKTLYVKKK